MTEHPLHSIAMSIRYDLTAAQGKLTEALRMVAELELPVASSGSFMNGPVTADSCEGCGVAAGRGHSGDCPVLVGEAK